MTSHTITAAMMGIMKCIAADRSIMAIMPIMTIIARRINSPDPRLSIPGIAIATGTISPLIQNAQRIYDSFSTRST